MISYIINYNNYYYIILGVDYTVGRIEKGPFSSDCLAHLRVSRKWSNIKKNVLSPLNPTRIRVEWLYHFFFTNFKNSAQY